MEKVKNKGSNDSASENDDDGNGHEDEHEDVLGKRLNYFSGHCM